MGVCCGGGSQRKMNGGVTIDGWRRDCDGCRRHELLMDGGGTNDRWMDGSGTHDRWTVAARTINGWWY
jgi:hypothetical protein